MRIEKTPIAYRVHIERGDGKPKPYSIPTIAAIFFNVSIVALFLLDIAQILIKPSVIDNDMVLDVVYNTLLYMLIIVIVNAIFFRAFHNETPSTSLLHIEDIIKAIEGGGTLVYLHDYQTKSMTFEKRSVKEYHKINDYYV